ncbi:MAG: response regulator transcription factor [Acidobacteriota bacterium]|nr:response regulator transcription factor [Acidobacteriota bacterium]
MENPLYIELPDVPGSPLIEAWENARVGATRQYGVRSVDRDPLREGRVRAKGRLVIADAHQLWRHVLRSLTEGFGSYAVVGEALDGRGLLERVEATRPDVIIMDIALPTSDGLRVLRHMAGLSPKPRVIVLSEIEEPEIVREAFAAGAMGYVSKCESAAILRRALVAVRRGFSFLSPSIARALLKFLQERTVSRCHRLQVPIVEIELLKLLAKGYSDRAVASMLGSSPNIVNFYRLDVLRRLPGTALEWAP